MKYLCQLQCYSAHKVPNRSEKRVYLISNVHNVSLHKNRLQELHNKYNNETCDKAFLNNKKAFKRRYKMTPSFMCEVSGKWSIGLKPGQKWEVSHDRVRAQDLLF